MVVDMGACALRQEEGRSRGEAGRDECMWVEYPYGYRKGWEKKKTKSKNEGKESSGRIEILAFFFSPTEATAVGDSSGMRMWN